MTYATLDGRTALITGAASGIGAATALLLARHGVRVALLARRADRLEEVAGKIRAEGGRALTAAADITEQRAVDAAVERVHSGFGPVDLVVNAAGVMMPNPIRDGRTDQWQRMLDTNVGGALRVIGAFTPDLVARAAEGGAADLVNISSIAAHLHFPDYAVYGATKAALTHLSQSLRTELGPRRVRVTNIEPGLTDTELPQGIDNAALASQLSGMFDAIGPLAAEEVADLVAYAASRARHVNLRQLVIQPTTQA
ncbi:SDR family oxidoreductase [Streptomyces sp. NPDC058279]|uniref:SDR family oxidoreductase n=1 Tax=Streptomyces sp. NPDC058279 TaxID=3346418 RepID=UPI0036F09CC7